MANKKNTIILTTLIASIICCICYICICLSILIFDHTTYSGCRHKGNSPDNYYHCPVGEEKDCDKYCDKIKDGTECNNNKMCHYRSSFFELITYSITDTITTHGEVDYCMLLDIDGKWYFDKYIKSKKQCDNKKNGFWCTSMNPNTTTDEICQVDHGINDSTDEMICPTINIDTDCKTGVDEPYPGCDRKVCQGSTGEDSQKPYPGCDCTADMMDEGLPIVGTGCHPAKCTNIDLPYPGCIQSDCVGVEDPYLGCKEQMCELNPGTNLLSYTEPYVGCIRDACIGDNSPDGCDITCKAQQCPNGWELNQAHRDTNVTGTDGVARMSVRKDENVASETDFRASVGGAGDDISVCCTPIDILDSTDVIEAANMVVMDGIAGSTTDGLNGIGLLACQVGYTGKPVVEVTRGTHLTLTGCPENICTAMDDSGYLALGVSVTNTAGTTVLGEDLPGSSIGTVTCASGYRETALPTVTCAGGSFTASGCTLNPADCTAITEDCTVVAGSADQEATTATTCTLTGSVGGVRACTVTNGSGTCDYVAPVVCDTT